MAEITRGAVARVGVDLCNEGRARIDELEGMVRHRLWSVAKQGD